MHRAWACASLPGLENRPWAPPRYDAIIIMGWRPSVTPSLQSASIILYSHASYRRSQFSRTWPRRVRARRYPGRDADSRIQRASRFVEGGTTRVPALGMAIPFSSASMTVVRLMALRVGILHDGSIIAVRRTARPNQTANGCSSGRSAPWQKERSFSSIISSRSKAAERLRSDDPTRAAVMRSAVEALRYRSDCGRGDT